jgi:hypothetical protein
MIMKNITLIQRRTMVAAPPQGVRNSLIYSAFTPPRKQFLTFEGSRCAVVERQQEDTTVFNNNRYTLYRILRTVCAEDILAAAWKQPLFRFHFLPQFLHVADGLSAKSSCVRKYGTHPHISSREKGTPEMGKSKTGKRVMKTVTGEMKTKNSGNGNFYARRENNHGRNRNFFRRR